jgi:hypothetical protein
MNRGFPSDFGLSCSPGFDESLSIQEEEGDPSFQPSEEDSYASKRRARPVGGEGGGGIRHVVEGVCLPEKMAKKRASSKYLGVSRLQKTWTVNQWVYDRVSFNPSTPQLGCESVGVWQIIGR